MANWKSLLAQVLLADGTIDAPETALLKRELLADGVVDREEVEFLTDLRNSARTASPEFTAFFFEALKLHLLADGVLDQEEAELVRKIILADGKIDDAERAFLAELKRGAKTIAPEFEKMLKDALAS
jgi:uncharacterized tellurite resistance protein B-like protein